MPLLQKRIAHIDYNTIYCCHSENANGKASLRSAKSVACYRSQFMPDIKLHLTIKSVYSLQKTFVYLSWLNSTVVGTMLALARG